MNILLDLFLSFAKVGLFTFGGGYAMIALIENTCVEKKQWITHDEMMNITVIAESTPGPIAINCATYVGYKQKGFAGALAATIGMVLPSFCIIFAISRFLDGSRKNAEDHTETRQFHRAQRRQMSRRLSPCRLLRPASHR